MTEQTLNEYLDNTLTILNTKEPSPEEIVQIAVDVMETIRYRAKERHLEKIDNIYDILLAKGLDLNKHITEYIFDDVIWIENTPVSIMLMKKFLEHGANPNLINPCEMESVFNYVDFAIGFDMFGVDTFMYNWLLLIAYGGRDEDGLTELVMSEGYDYEIFKEIDNYGYYIEEKETRYHIAHFFDKRTNNEVATYEKHWNIS